MKKLIQTLLVISLMAATAAVADVKKGQKFYLKSFKSKFGMNGAKFASLHTMDEWSELFEDEGEGFIEKYSEEFPRATKVLNSKKMQKKMTHLRDFVIEYANDSGNVPSCG